MGREPLIFAVRRATEPRQLEHGTEMETLLMYLVTALFFGAIPLAFTATSAFVVFRRHRTLAPVILVLLLYQSLSIVVLSADPIPEKSAFLILAIALPIALALIGSIWTVVTTKAVRERVCGIGISTIGCALTGCQVACYVAAVWGTI